MLIGVVQTKALWYLTRGTGLATLLLLTASVVLGVTETVRWASPRWPRFVTAALHRNVSLLVLVLLAVHIVTSVVDGFVPIRWIDVVLPFVSAYRAVWLGLGALAFDLLLALVVTSLLRQHIGYRTWKAIHWTAYACWPVSVLHGLGTGSDTRLGWVLVLNLACLGAVLGAVWWRLAAEWEGGGVRTGAALLSVAAPLAMLGWLVTGPLRPGWARRAGTPTTALAGATSPATGPSNTSPATGPSASGAVASGSAAAGTPAATTPAPAGLRPPFTAQLAGTLTQRNVEGQRLTAVTIEGTLSGGAEGTLQLVLEGPPTDDGGVRMLTSRAALGTATQPTLYQGRVTGLDGTTVVADVQDAAGHLVRVAARLSITGTTVRGLVQATAETGG